MRFTRATRRTRRTSTHALVARFKLSALLAHLTTKTLPTLIVVGLEVPVLAPTERPLPFATSLRSIVCFSRIARGTHHHRQDVLLRVRWLRWPHVLEAFRILPETGSSLLHYVGA